MSKKHRKWAEKQHRADNDEAPTSHAHGETTMIYTVKLQPDPDEEKRHTDEDNDRKKQICSAKMLNIITGIGVGIAGLTFIALVIYAWITHGQLVAMLESNDLTQQSLSVSQRAYVTIGTKDGVVAKFIPSQDLKQNAELVLYFQNSGHVPAKLAWGTTDLRFVAVPQGTHESSGITYTHPFKFMSRTRNKKNGTVSEPEGDDVAGDSIFVAPIGQISQKDLTNLPSKNLSTLVMGMYQYCDELGTDILHSFDLTYQNAPNADLSFKLLTDEEIQFPAPVSTSDTEYLSTCQTIAERGQKQK